MSRKGSTTVLPALGVLLFSVLLWGLAPVANRYLLRSISPIHLAVVRFVVASLLFVPIVVRMRKQRWSRADLLRALLCGLASILGYNVTATIGIQWVPAGIASLLTATSPLWITVLSRIFERTPLHWAVVVGLALGLGGIVTLIGWTALQPAQQGTLFLGMGLLLLASLMWAIYTVAVRPLSARYGSPVSTGITTIAGTLPLLFLWDPRLLPSVGHFRSADWLAFTLLALGSTVVATILWNYGVSRLPSSQAGIFLNLLPVVGAMGGKLFLDEPISQNMLLSGIIIIAGVVVTQIPLFMPSHQQPATSDAPLEERTSEKPILKR